MVFRCLETKSRLLANILFPKILGRIKKNAFLLTLPSLFAVE